MGQDLKRAAALRAGMQDVGDFEWNVWAEAAKHVSQLDCNTWFAVEGFKHGTTPADLAAELHAAVDKFEAWKFAFDDWVMAERAWRRRRAAVIAFGIWGG